MISLIGFDWIGRIDHTLALKVSLMGDLCKEKGYHLFIQDMQLVKNILILELV